jgi:hypothetical protein
VTLTCSEDTESVSSLSSPLNPWTDLRLSEKNVACSWLLRWIQEWRPSTFPELGQSTHVLMLWCTSQMLYFIYLVMRLELRAPQMVGKCSDTELHPHPFLILFWDKISMNCNLLASVSQIAGIIGMYHHVWLLDAPSIFEHLFWWTPTWQKGYRGSPLWRQTPLFLMFLAIHVWAKLVYPTQQNKSPDLSSEANNQPWIALQAWGLHLI